MSTCIYKLRSTTPKSTQSVPKHQRKKYVNFAKGDRVAILKGVDKGKIGVIDSVDVERESVTLKDHNIVRIYFPHLFGQD